jgi:hypothetical protein
MSVFRAARVATRLERVASGGGRRRHGDKRPRHAGAAESILIVPDRSLRNVQSALQSRNFADINDQVLVTPSRFQATCV